MKTSAFRIDLQLYLKRLIFTLGVVLAIFPFLRPEAAVASCAGPLPLTQYLEMADVVAIGTVTSSADTHANFSVERYFKGRGPREIKVTGREVDAPGVITSVDFTLKDGGRYVLFLKGSPPDTLKTNSCAGSREVQGDLTQEEASVLGAGSPPLETPTLLPATSESSSSTRATTSVLLTISLLAGLSLLLFSRKRKQGRA